MGKRKERRLAALSGAGRRVKLDLRMDDAPPPSEPTGAVAGTSLHDEAGGHVDQTHGVGVHSSPSSSAQQPNSLEDLKAEIATLVRIVLALLDPREENPLSLLGQYSDDDLGEEESKQTKDAVILDTTSSAHANEQVVDFLADLQNHGLLQDKSIDTNLDSSVMHEDAKEEIVVNAVEASAIVIEDATASTDPDLCTVKNQRAERAESDWKAVMHEESGQYYYWNIITGETTWAMPSTLAQAVAKCSYERDPMNIESLQDIPSDLCEGRMEKEPGVPGLQDEPTSSLVYPQVSVIPPRCSPDKKSELKEQLNESNGDVQLTSCDQKKDVLKDVPSSAQEYLYKDLNTHNCVLSEETVDVNFAIDGMKNNSLESLPKIEEPEGHKQMTDLKQNIEEESYNALELLKWSENLVQRFKALQGASDSVSALSWQLRYAVEAEIRLADCRALSSYGASLEAYWSYLQEQLKRLESVLSVEEAAISAGSEQSNFLHSRQISSTKFLSLNNRIASKTLSGEINSHGKDKMPTSVENEQCVTSPQIEQCMAFPLDENCVTTTESYSKDEEHGNYSKQQTCEGSSDPPHDICNDTGNDLEEGEIRNLSIPNVRENAADESPLQNEENDLKKVADTSVEKVVDKPLEKVVDKSLEKVVESSNAECDDVDMEVDMEVDDQTSTKGLFLDEAGTSSIDGQELQSASFAPSLSLANPSFSTVSVSSFPIPVSDDTWGASPQPPEDDWAPPPPPDSDSFTPPPPDEPPPPLPPSEPCNVYEEPLCPVLPYTEQYASAYGPMANYDYYSSASTEAANPEYYVGTDVQTNGIHLSYYDQTVNAYVEGSGLSNPVEGVIYYEPISSTIPESSAHNNPECTTMYCENVGASTYYGSCIAVTDTTQVYSGITTAVTGNPFASVGEGEVASAQAETSVASSSTVADPSTGGVTAGAKAVSKDVRSKKRSVAVASTLRSNKKVSSLVDKWKAAKEELHCSDDEDEDDKALDVLERKRQREIEEWRMQQIASGEAQDNANFQPLGGDWREKVKRRKLEVNAEKIKSQSISVTDTAKSNGSVEREKPDLVEISKGLPSGWQAFWDESSSEVYYGNLTTSETTWDRPK